MYTTEQLSEGVKALKFCRDSAVKLSDETIAGLVYDYMTAINRPVTQAEGDAKDARIKVLEDALTNLLRHTNSIEVLGEWSATDTNISSGIKLRAKVDACIKEACAAIASQKGAK